MHVEPILVLRLMTIFGKTTSTWPTDFNPKIFKVKKIEKLKWLLSFLNVICLLLPLIFGVYYNSNNSAVMMKTLSELTALGDVFINLIICKIQEKRLQKLLSEVTKYAETVQGRDKIIFKKNINRYLPFCLVVGLSYFQTAVAFSLGPLFMFQILPADAWYPFQIELSSVIYYFIYLQQVLAILQTGMCITVDFMVAMLLCYASTKLEILSLDFQHISTDEQLSECIKKHQECIHFADEVRHAVKFIILKSNMTMAMAAIFGAFPIILHEPLPVISQFILMVIGGCLRLYVSAWPADNLRRMSENIAWSLYNSKWINGSLKMRKSMMIIIRRAQKPLVISVIGVLPPLTLQYYAAFLSSTLSYFMTLRAVIGK
ncbi:hypothetical protein PV328_009639 [Microctonus aethiopoides]|uniref:Odorant receptor n=1 Tax=Microctonus aethiopoides TaxID=144406 RepID=A0AA39C6B8_9HYME|nr:hypothetical protein PV328_009639 [Microctonus aethiopoides]